MNIRQVIQVHIHNVAARTVWVGLLKRSSSRLEEFERFEKKIIKKITLSQTPALAL